jgi:hypothetical protein
VSSDRTSSRELHPGTFVRWIDPARRTKPLGIVLAPVGEDMVYVLMGDAAGNTDVEVFVARVEATGVPAQELALESVEIVADPDRDLAALLREEAARIEAEINP